MRTDEITRNKKDFETIINTLQSTINGNNPEMVSLSEAIDIIEKSIELINEYEKYFKGSIEELIYILDDLED